MMHLKGIIICVLMASFLIVSDKSQHHFFDLSWLDRDQERLEYSLIVKVIDGEWRVVFEEDESRSDVTLRRGDRIRWVVEGSDASFQFPDVRIFGQETREVKAGNPMVMAVSENSPKGTFPYTVFIHESMTYARGQSPPRIIVK
jgi:hypothetical protein